MMHSKGTQMTDRTNANQPLPLNHDASVFDSGSWVGRVWLPEQGPAVVLVKAGAVYDISTHVATVSALLEVDDPVAYLRALPLERWRAIGQRTRSRPRCSSARDAWRFPRWKPRVIGSSTTWRSLAQRLPRRWPRSSR